MNYEMKTIYFAGLIDGEANIGAYPRRGQSIYPRPVIKVSMTCKKTIEALADHFGGNVIAKKVYNNWKPQWSWELNCNKALDAIEIVRPYLITKAANADFVLSVCVRGRQGKKRTTGVNKEKTPAALAGFS